MTMTISSTLSFLKDQSVETLSLVQDFLRKIIVAKTPSDGFENISVKMPDFGIAHYIFPTYLEAIFVAWAQEWSSNYSQDYGTKDPSSLINDSSLVISNAYNDVIQQDGQFPRLVVRCNGLNSSSSAVGNDMTGASEPRASEVGANFTKTFNKQGCYLHSTMTLYCLSQHPNEANMLGGAAFGALLESRMILQDVFSLQQIGFPSMSCASPVKESPRVYASTIDFSVMQIIAWSNVLKKKHYKNMIFKICAILKKEPTPAIEQIIGAFPIPLSEDLKRRLEELG